MNKRKRTGLFLSGVLLIASAGHLPAQQIMSLDGVITQAAKDIQTRTFIGAKLAVLNFSSSAEAFSDYVVEELSGALVMNRQVTIIERRSLDLVRKEMNLQLSGDVSDDSAQAIGKQLGAQAIVTGSLTNLGDTYRFRVKVINVESARIEAQFSYNLGNNQQVAFLLNGDPQSAPPVKTAPPPASSRLASAKDGTYTFAPRLRAWRGAMNVDSYLDRIVVRNGYMTFFLYRSASGFATNDPTFSYYPRDKIVLQDLDKESNTYNPVEAGDADGVGLFYTFQNVQGTRFKFSDSNNPPNFFEEIILGEPDK